MRSRTTCVGAVVMTVIAAALLGMPCRAEDKKPKEEPKKLTVMQRKLHHAQAVLEGLATKDFKKIDSGADGLLDCLKDETWKINETEKYLAHLKEFRARVEGMKKAVKDKNIDAAALSYVDMTLTCVRCHQYLRESDVRAVPDLTPFISRR